MSSLAGLGGGLVVGRGPLCLPSDCGGGREFSPLSQRASRGRLSAIESKNSWIVKLKNSIILKFIQGQLHQDFGGESCNVVHRKIHTTS